ncbi:Potassium transporter [Sporothrix epigloea]|uniref:Potassium transporter n=1 Tax=Sporothrix epigloea TaxID=1892477 RepID=A0ABP0DFN4_9PEZI
MGFMSHGVTGDVRPEQKWDYIGLNDFKSQSCFTPIAYVYLYFSLCLSIAVYAVDTFTAVNLLVFDRWSSEIAPTQLISFTVSKWIFSICIILSVVNLAYEHIRALRIMRRGSVAECYLDNLAVRLESVRIGTGQGHGWKRFLVFAELTRSKKGAEYIALFTYFSFQSWIRVLLCSGPRQVVNALTLLSVYNAQLSVTGNNIGNTLLHFFDKIRILAEGNFREALILSGMIFTLVIWVFSFLSLLLAFLFFLFFLWGYIPRSDGGLSGYCSRKINKRLMKIVTKKVNAALEEEERRRKKAELKAAKKKGELPPTELKATIPDVSDATLSASSQYVTNSVYGGSIDKLPATPNSLMLQRNDTMTTLPPYSSRPGTAAGGPNNSSNSSFELSSMDQKPRPTMSSMRPGTVAPIASTSTWPVPTRSGTISSTSSLAAPKPINPNYSARAPLLEFAAEPCRSASPTSMMVDMDRDRPVTRNRLGGPGDSLPPYDRLNRTNTSGSSMPYNYNDRNDSFSSFASVNNDSHYSNQYPGDLPPMPRIPQPVRSPGGPVGPDGYGFNGRINDDRPPTADIYAAHGFNNNQSGLQDFDCGGYNNSAIDIDANSPPSITGPHQPGYRPGDSNMTGRARHTPPGRSYDPRSGPWSNHGATGHPGQGREPNIMTPVRGAADPYPDPPWTHSGTGRGSPSGPLQRNMTAPVPQLSNQTSHTGPSHGRQISEDTSYTSYFERPTTSPNQRSPGSGSASGSFRLPNGHNFGNSGNSNEGTHDHDVEAQRGGRY